MSGSSDFEHVIYKTSSDIYFNTEVNEETVGYFIKMIDPIISEWRDELDNTSIFTDTKEKITVVFPYRIIIGSEGGRLDAGLRLYSYLEEMKEHDAFEILLHTHASAGIASMGSLLHLVGDIRTMDKRALIMYHQFSGGAFGKYEDLKGWAKQWDDIYKIVLDIIMERTGLCETKAKELASSDIFLTFDQAVEYGVLTKQATQEYTDEIAMRQLAMMLPPETQALLHSILTNLLEEEDGVSQSQD